MGTLPPTCSISTRCRGYRSSRSAAPAPSTGFSSPASSPSSSPALPAAPLARRDRAERHDLLQNGIAAWLKPLAEGGNESRGRLLPCHHRHLPRRRKWIRFGRTTAAPG